MPPTSSTMLPLGTEAPQFTLPRADSGVVSLSDYSGAKGLLVVFACNHCPFVVHVKDELQRVYADYGDLGLAMVAISSNDSDEYPQDSPANMRDRADEWGWTFPYLFDEDQSVAKAYRASCTPDFFLFDEELRLCYRGQLDDSRPNSPTPVTGADLRHAIDSVLRGEMPSATQKPSVGCSIKWKPGNAPDYALSSV